MTRTKHAAAPPRGKPPKRPPGYDEGVNEAPDALDAEAVEVEEAIPADERTSVESVKPADTVPPVFEE